MDALITAAARALGRGEVLQALQHVGLRDDPPALALRGIAMARLGELDRARALLQRAARAFGPRETRAKARCIVADAEVALAMRDLRGSPQALARAGELLAAQGDEANAGQALLIAARRALLVGRLGDAASLLARLDGQALPAALHAMAALVRAELAARSLDSYRAQAALRLGADAAARTGIPALDAEIAALRNSLRQAAARCRRQGAEQALRLDEVGALLASDTLVIDACRRVLRRGGDQRSLARRPVLFSLLRTLAEAWPLDAARDALILHAFRLRDADDTHRARLRVELGRLRALVAPLARILATPRGYVLQPQAADPAVAVLLPPIDGDDAALLALLDDGVAWSTHALAQALDASQRTVQRALADLAAAGRVRSIGRGRTQRWVAPTRAGFATILLLPAALPSS